jgi:peptidoglycan/LPS O-acetylase OafA/YrhL
MVFLDAWQLLPGVAKPLGHFWSLSLEEQFYLVWPLLVAACSRRLLARISILLLLIGVGLRFTLSNKLLTYGLLPAHLEGLLGGAPAVAGACFCSAPIRFRGK